MPNYRVLKRRAEDTAEKYQKWNDIMAAYNEQVEGFNTKGAEFNAWQDSVKAGATSGYFRLENGNYMALTGRHGKLAPVDYHKKARPVEYKGVFDSVNAAKEAGFTGNFLVRNPDGTATPHTATTVEYDWSNTGGDGGSALPEEVQIPWTASNITNKFNPVVRIGEFTEKPPTEPNVKMPTMDFTNSQINEISNPHLQGANANRVQAMGNSPNTALSEGPSGLSASVSGELHDNTENMGILQQVLGGKL